MTINKASLELIKEFEGWRANAYPDPATNAEPWTIGYGHTSAAGPPKVYKGLTITKDEGEAILIRDLAAVEATVDHLVTVPLNANQRGALVSFTFNLGGTNLGKSTLLKKVNAKDFAAATAEFKKWDKAAGKVMAGLTRRRAAEAALFAKPVSPEPLKHLGPVDAIEAPVTPIEVHEEPLAPTQPKTWWMQLIEIITGKRFA